MNKVSAKFVTVALEASLKALDDGPQAGGGLLGMGCSIF